MAKQRKPTKAEKAYGMARAGGQDPMKVTKEGLRKAGKSRCHHCYQSNSNRSRSEYRCQNRLFVQGYQVSLRCLQGKDQNLYSGRKSQNYNHPS